MEAAEALAREICASMQGEPPPLSDEELQTLEESVAYGRRPRRRGAGRRQLRGVYFMGPASASGEGPERVQPTEI